MKLIVKQIFRGFLRMMVGVAVAGVLSLAVYGFVSIPEVGGYVAVLDFLMTAAALIAALFGMFAMGSKSKKGGKFHG